jgi:hypothetical protein
MVVEPAHRGSGDESFISLRDLKCTALEERERIRPVTVSQEPPLMTPTTMPKPALSMPNVPTSTMINVSVALIAWR